MLTKTIPSYPYKQYDDDEDIVAWFTAYNNLVQDYVDWFNKVGLPIYTGESSLVFGPLLDWVGSGLYGFSRPVLPHGKQPSKGAINSTPINFLAINSTQLHLSSDVYVTTDDTYRRCLTWLFYKGDGKQFTIRWLKRRIARFLIPTIAQGIDQERTVQNKNIDQTYRISITFGPTAKTVNINLINEIVVIQSGPINVGVINGSSINSGKFSAKTFPKFRNAEIFKAAIDNGILELPFSYSWVVNI